MSKTILVAGGTGGVGRHVVQLLQQQGYQVRVLARNLKKAKDKVPSAIEIISGDVTEPDSLDRAFEGVDAIISAIGSRSPMGANKPEHIDYGGLANLVNAAKKAGITRFLSVSSCSVTNPKHPLNMFGKILTWKFRAEEYLRKSGLEYTIVRPGGLTDEKGEKFGLNFGQGDKISGIISREDVAKVLVAALEDEDAKQKTFEIVQDQGKPVPSLDDLKSEFKNLLRDS